ncbi:restriction endonuclease subunit S [Vibrio alginolyticus]|uniref:restriction endonuclease subunit S n=1 Tax=Vibrio alginolyticus TaxID=663 RepID=UPI002119DC7D|nr:restriction endonuclease subunit S [Vibrio alginolyticus]MCQ9087101.1 restriction endonuclease subunit S [Vibrio alginolyticus]
MTVEKKVPEIRFKGFSGEWEERCWCDTVDISTNMVDPRNGLYSELRHVGPGNIESFTGRFYDNVLKVKDSHLISGKFHFHKGDIIYGKINPQLAKYVIAPFEGLASADAYVLNAKNGVVQNYLFTILHSEDFYKYTVSVSSRTGMPKINRDELNIYSFMAPYEEEQTAIGNYFQKLDSLINQHQQKHDKLCNIKKAMLEKMFPKQGETIPEIRFKGFSGEWKSTALAELALFNPREDLPANFKYVDLESVKGTSLIGYRKELKDNAPSRAQRLAKKGDVFFQTVRPYQKNNYLFNKDDDDFVFSTGYAQLRPYYDGEFLLNLVQRAPFVRDVLDNCTGTSYPAINASILAGLRVQYPESKEEQAAIGSHFQKLDTLINQHQQQITKLTNIKQACLSKMFV